MIWFISDTHFGHANIIQYTGRPFKDVHEMDKTMIANWNSVVHQGDVVYHLGDFCLGGMDEFERYYFRLNGSIVFVGSDTHHDKRWRTSIRYNYGGKVEVVSDVFMMLRMSFTAMLDVNRFPPKIVLSHFPYAVWEDKHYGIWHLHGHVHKPWTPEGGFSMNMSVENIGYKPMSIFQVADAMAARGWTKDWKEFGDADSGN